MAFWGVRVAVFGVPGLWVSWRWGVAVCRQCGALVLPYLGVAGCAVMVCGRWDMWAFKRMDITVSWRFFAWALGFLKMENV